MVSNTTLISGEKRKILLPESGSLEIEVYKIIKEDSNGLHNVVCEIFSVPGIAAIFFLNCDNLDCVEQPTDKNITEDVAFQICEEICKE